MATASGAILVVDVGVPIVGLLQVGADVVEVLFLGHGHRIDADFGFFDEHDRVALAHHVAFGHRDFTDDAIAVRGDDVLHLHGFHDGNLLAGADLVAGGDVEGHDRALDRRAEAGCAIRGVEIGSGLSFGLARLCFDARVMVEQGQRVAGVDARACKAGLARIGLLRLGRDEAWPRRRGRRRQFGEVFVDPARGYPPGREVVVVDHVVEERDVGADAFEAELGERPGRSGDGARKVP